MQIIYQSHKSLRFDFKVQKHFRKTIFSRVSYKSIKKINTLPFKSREKTVYVSK